MEHDALDQALNYIDQHWEPELLEMALKHTSFNAWVTELCQKAHEDRREHALHPAAREIP